MTTTLIVIILSIILATVSVIFIFNSFLKHFKGSDNGFVNILIIIPIVVALFCSLCGIFGGFSYRETLEYYELTKKYKPDDMITLLQNINNLKYYMIVGYASIFTSYGILKMVINNIKKAIEKNKHSRWNLNAIQNNDKTPSKK